MNIPKIGENEPMFILRAQDVLAGPAIEMYKLLGASHGCALAEKLQKEIDVFRQWRGPKKLPD